MSKDFSVYKWRREQLALNENLDYAITMKKGKTTDGKEYDGYYKVFSSTEDKEVKADMVKKGYEFIDIVTYEDPGRKTEYWYHFKKK